MIPSGTLVLLDTNVLLHLARGNATGQQIASSYELLERPDRPLISIVTVGEILTFARRHAWGQAKLDRLYELLNELVIVSIAGRAIADRYARVTAHCEDHGHILSDNDRWIAATAAATNSVLLSTDRDFDPLHPDFLTLARM